MRLKVTRFRVALLALGAFALGGVAGVAALLYRPGWYVPPALDRARFEQDSRALVNLVDRIGVALHSNRPADVRLDQQQVNRWVVARDEWPAGVGQLELETVAEPLVLFLGGGRLRLAASARSADLSVVVSCDLRIMLDRDRVICGLDAARVGALPLPRSLVADFVGRAFSGHPELQELLRRGFTSWPNEWVWPNGKRRFRIGACQFEQGAARLRLEPL